MKRLILILLTCVMLMGCLVSCNFGNTQPNAQPEPEPPATNDPIDYTKADDTPNMTISYDMSLVANLYLALDETEAAEKIYLTQFDGQLTVGDIVFDQVSYGENVEVKFEGAYACSDPQISVEYNGAVSGTEGEKEILTIMARIIQQKNCYLLKSSTDNKIAEYIAAYYFDEVCYLVFFNENGVAFSVYRMEVEYTEFVLTEGTDFVAEGFAIWEVLSSSGQLKIKVIDGKVYNWDRLYNVIYYNDLKMNYEWCQDKLHAFGEYSHEEMMDIVVRINSEKGCFVIESAGDNSQSHSEYAVYCFDNVYYLVDVTDGYRGGVYVYRMYYYSPVE